MISSQVTLALRDFSATDYLVLTSPLLLLLWDAVRKPGEPWFRWLLPGGYILLVIAIGVSLILLVPAVLIMSAGLGLTNYWRWTGRNTLKRKGRHRLPVYRPPKNRD